MQAAYLRHLLCAGQGLCMPPAATVGQTSGSSAASIELDRQDAWRSTARLTRVDPDALQHALGRSSLLAQKATSAFAQALAAGEWQLQPFMLASAERQPYALAS